MTNIPRVKVLIIDDEKVILKMLSKRLTKIGFAVDTADTAEKGIENITSTSYDLILTDIKMPGMSGHDVCKYVKIKVKKSVPVIAMSGTPWLLRNSNFDAVIEKPFVGKYLLEVIHQFVQIAHRDRS